MWNYISKLQKKSKGHRRRVVFVISALITLAIVAIWASTLGSRISSKASARKTDEKIDPFKSIKTIVESIDIGNIGNKNAD